MRVFSRTAHTEQRLAVTNIVNLLDNQLILILRAWGSTEYNQKFIDEVKYYLSSTQADLEVTTPFEYQTNLSKLANRTRVAMLLAHDLFYKTENKNEYTVGFEATLLFKAKNELAWSSVGRFSLDKITDNTLRTYMKNGSDLDSEILLPIQLVGVEREIDISSGSLTLTDDSKIIISSTYKCDILVNNNQHNDQSQNLLEVSLDFGANSGAAYWYSVISAD